MCQQTALSICNKRCNCHSEAHIYLFFNMVHYLQSINHQLTHNKSKFHISLEVIHTWNNMDPNHLVHTIKHNLILSGIQHNSARHSTPEFMFLIEPKCLKDKTVNYRVADMTRIMALKISACCPGNTFKRDNKIDVLSRHSGSNITCCCCVIT